MNTGRLDDFSRYDVYKNGDVISHVRKIPRKLKRMNHNIGYHRYKMVSDAGKQCIIYVHRVVAEAFKGKIPDDMEVNHLDGNKQNNHLSNLEIVTHAENQKHASENGLLAKGEEIFTAKLKTFDVQIIKMVFRELKGKSFVLQTKKNLFSKIYGVSDTCIDDIYRDKGWKHVKIC